MWEKLSVQYRESHRVFEGGGRRMGWGTVAGKYRDLQKHGQARGY